MKLRKLPAGVHPELLHPDYKSTAIRAPRQPTEALEPAAAELSGPRFDGTLLYQHHDDMTRQTGKMPLGERIIVTGHVLDENDDPLLGYDPIFNSVLTDRARERMVAQ